MNADPYCYPGTSILRNNFDIQDLDELHEAESRIATIGLFLWQDETLVGPADEGRLKATHHAIFHRLYPFAGSYRENTGTMTKGRALGYQVTYGDSRFVPSEMARIFAQLGNENYLRNLSPDAFATRMAWFYSEMDATHPFREGNSRTLRQFSTDLALSAHYQLDWTPTGDSEDTKNALYRARDLAAHRGDLGQLTAIIAANITPLPS